MRGPESVIERGPLKAEIVTVRSCRAMRANASSSANPTASIVPSPRPHDSMRRARSATIRAASSTRKNAGNARRRDFAHAMADNGRRLNAPGFPKRRERHLHRKNGRLPDLRPVHLGGFLGAAEFFEQREVRPRTQRSVALVQSPRRNTGSCSIKSRPIPHHCGPCPLMMKPMRGGCSRRAVKAARIFGLSSFFANASSSSVSSAQFEVTRVSSDAGDDSAGRPTYK